MAPDRSEVVGPQIPTHKANILHILRFIRFINATFDYGKVSDKGNSANKGIIPKRNHRIKDIPA